MRRPTHRQLWSYILICMCGALSGLSLAHAQTPGAMPEPAVVAADPVANPEAGNAAASGERSLDDQVQGLKHQVIDLNRDLFTLQEDLLFPANTQVAVFVSIDVGTFFDLDGVKLTLDGKEVAGYLYTEREAKSLLQGGVQRLFVGNLKTGTHELIALFNGKGPHDRDYRSGTTIKFDKGIGAKFIELKVSDRKQKLQPEFLVRIWE